MYFAGRTDSGVHAIAQTVNFFSNCNVPDLAIKSFLNNSLENISILSVSRESHDFNSRKSAVSRAYVYKFTEHDVPTYLSNNLLNVPFPVDDSTLELMLNELIGTYDYSLFWKKGSGQINPIRTITKAFFTKAKYKLLTESNKTIIIYNINFEANAYLYRMIRNIIGCMLIVLNPNNSITLPNFIKSFKEKKRLFNYTPAPSKGLYLKEICY